MGFFSHTHNIFAAILLAGTTLMLLFIVFSGAIKEYPFNHFYWVQADTSSIPDAGGDFTRWTFWGLCYPDTYSQGAVNNCPNLGPDVPISPFDNFGNSTALPQDFITNRDTYYYLSRFTFPFLLISLIFTGVSFVGSVIAPCWLAMKQVITFFVCLANIFCITGAATGTAVAVMTRNQFHKSHMESKVGAAILGMLWASVFCLVLTNILMVCSVSNRLYKTYLDNKKKLINIPQSNQEPLKLTTQPPSTIPIDDSNPTQGHESSGIRFFKIRRNQDKVEEDSIV